MECPELSEPDSCDIHEAAVTPRPAFELSRLGREKTLPGPLAARRCSNCEAMYLRELGLPPGLGEWETRGKTQ